MACIRPCAKGPCGFFTLIIWWILGGVLGGFFWYVFGCIFCCLPGIGKAARRVGCLYFDPLSNKVINKPLEINNCGDLCASAFNIVWLVLAGWELCLLSLISAILCLPLYCCCLPFSKIHWEFAKIALWPIGVELQGKNEVLVESKLQRVVVVKN